MTMVVNGTIGGGVIMVAIGAGIVAQKIISKMWGDI